MRTGSLSSAPRSAVPFALAFASAFALAPPALAEPKDEAPPAEPEEAEDTTSGWFRVDTDAASTQFWLGATHEVGPLAIASDVYVVDSFAELDVGPAFQLGPVTLTPMVGVGFDFSTTEFTTVVAPQLFTILDLPHLYAENWIQVFYNTPFMEEAEDLGYSRLFVLGKLGDLVAIGPQAEVTYRFGAMSGVTSAPVGGRINLGYGENNTLGIFLGYDGEAPAESDRIAGRFTFVRTW